VTRGFVSLLADMGKCRICHNLELGPNPIFQLSAKARLLILGQAPGRIAHAKNRPFDDPSGDRLRRWLGVDQETFYTDPKIGIFPMGLCFPGGGKGGDQPPRAVCAEIWRQPVLDHLKQRQFTVVMGRYATDWHMPHLRRHSVAEAARASFEEAGAQIILPHPSPRNMRWFRNHPWFEEDVIPALQERVAKALLT